MRRLDGHECISCARFVVKRKGGSVCWCIYGSFCQFVQTFLASLNLSNIYYCVLLLNQIKYQLFVNTFPLISAKFPAIKHNNYINSNINTGFFENQYYIIPKEESIFLRYKDLSMSVTRIELWNYLSVETSLIQISLSS